MELRRGRHIDSALYDGRMLNEYGEWETRTDSTVIKRTFLTHAKILD